MSSIYWLLSDDALQRRLVREIREARTPLNAWSPRATARADAPALPAPLTIANGVATIHVGGVLTPVPDPMAEFYGEANTTYPELQAALAAALADPGVREIVWAIDSPGGSVDGYHSLIADIADARAAGMRMRVEADNAQSAAYGIAAAAGPITATSRTASFGSVGVAVSAFVQGGLCGKVVDVTNSASPDKRPNVETPEGIAVVQAYLDQMAAEFMGGIARGRGVSTAAVESGYGRGASMLAPKAKEMGLIDGIAARVAKRATRSYAALDRTPGVGYGPASMAEPAPVAPALAEPVAEPEAPAGDPPVETPEAPAPAEPPAGDPPVAISAADLAELAELRAERAAKQTTEREALVGALVALRAETPGTAYANGVLVARLSAEPLAELRTRVAALKAQAPAAPAAAHTPPPVGAPGDGLNDSQRAAAAKMKDPAVRERFVTLCAQQNAQRQGKA